MTQNHKTPRKNKVWKKFLDIGLGDNFLHVTPKAQGTKAEASGTALNSFCGGKETINTTGKPFANRVSDQRLVSKIDKELP